jgi:hypothetical protein
VIAVTISVASLSLLAIDYEDSFDELEIFS